MTLHPTPRTSGLFKPLDKDPRSQKAITKLTIPAESKPHLRRQLAHLGFDEHILFPDLFGLGRWLNDLHRLGRADWLPTVRTDAAARVTPYAD